MAIDGGTHGKLVPSVHAVRAACGVSSGGLSTANYKEVLEALLPASVVRHYYVNPSPIRALRDDLAAGFGVVLAIDYDQIPNQYSGQYTFDGNHAIYISGWRWLNGLRQTRDRDPLFDGRCKSWGCAPDHALLVPLRVLIQAAEKYAGGPGLFAGASVQRAVR